MPSRLPSTHGVSTAGSSGWRPWIPAVLAVVRRPDLWSTAVRQSLNLAPNRWWTRRPWLPLPAAGYLRFRMLTAYGDGDRGPDGHDVITWLEWRRSWKSVTGSGRAVPARPAANATDQPTSSH